MKLQSQEAIDPEGPVKNKLLGATCTSSGLRFRVWGLVIEFKVNGVRFTRQDIRLPV